MDILEEVNIVVWNCDGVKSPGLDGFNINFIKECWDLIKEDMTRFVKCFHKYGTWPK